MYINAVAYMTIFPNGIDPSYLKGTDTLSGGDNSFKIVMLPF